MTCRPNPDGPRLLPTHKPDCETAACQGCQPCGQTHCTTRRQCGRHIATTGLTCPTCLGNTRNDLATIVKRSSDLTDEATHAGINSEAANLAGPAADPEQLSARRIYTKRHITDTLPPEQWEAAHTLIEDEDPHHPYAVLGRWEMMLREHYGHHTDRLITIGSAAHYLDGILTHLAEDPWQDFPLFAREIRACRAHLEAVLKDSRAPEAGAPCYMCDARPNVVRKHRELRDRHRPTDRQGYTIDSDGQRIPEDGWECPDCKTWWTDADYDRWVSASYVVHADKLTADQIKDTYRINSGTLRYWASQGKVRRRGKDASGRQTYDVGDAILARDQGRECVSVGPDSPRANADGGEVCPWGLTDLGPAISSINEDVKRLAAVTVTPPLPTASE